MAKNTKNENVNNDETVIEKKQVQDTQDNQSAETIELSPLEKAQKEAAEYKDMALRKMAELENYRRNNQNIILDVRERTIREVLENILPALDGFNRASELITDEKTQNGVNIIKEQLLNVLTKYDVTEIEAIGKEFNPELHECIMQVDNPEMSNKIVYEIEKGYKIGDKILRYSRVAVGK